MEPQQRDKKYSIMVSDSFGRTDEKHRYEPAFRRWLVREIEEGRMTVSEAVKAFNFNPQNGSSLIQSWRTRYAPEMVLNLGNMTEKEKQDLKLLKEQNKVLEKQLEDARMKNIALSLLIDVAEEKLNITIRKKPGAKQ
jgi:transposase-like protein